MNANQLAHIVQRDPLGKRELEFEPAVHWFACQHLVGNLGAHADAPAISRLLNAARFFQRDHDARVKLLPHAGHCREYGWRNFSYVLGDGLGVLDEVELGAGVHRVVFAAHPFSDVAQRQKAHALVVVILRHQRVVAMQGVDQATVQVHRPFGLAGRTRGVNEDGQVLRPALSRTLFDGIRMPRQVLTSQLAQSRQADDAGVVHTAQTFHVKHDNLAQFGQLSAHFQCFVQLLVVFDKQNRGAGVFA